MATNCIDANGNENRAGETMMVIVDSDVVNDDGCNDIFYYTDFNEYDQADNLRFLVSRSPRRSNRFRSQQVSERERETASM